MVSTLLAPLLRFPNFPHMRCRGVKVAVKVEGRGARHDTAKTQPAAKGYSQVEGVDNLESFARTACTTSNRLNAAIMACKLDWDLRAWTFISPSFRQSWIPRFEASVSMSGCLGSPRTFR